jgi:uncharacterized protein YyaL (SSP411 family)
MTVLRALQVFVLVVGCAFPACGGEETRPPRADAMETPPGAPDYSPELKKTLATALAAKGETYEPRTHHLRDDGSPVYTNRLILESSPYLNQHAHNPVNWYPWGDEAFETARRLGRPVLLSVGYSTCHWCHVMERESFEDLEIARYINENYIAIKVDREERPDVDSIYMSAVQAMTRRGGWPMTVWLTPEAKPFYGGTYFPPRDGDRGQRVGFLTLLTRLKTAYDTDADKVRTVSDDLSTALQRSLAPLPAGEIPGAEVLANAANLYRRQFDEVEGGLKRAPKFPSSLPIRFLLRYDRRSDDGTFLDMATLTLRKMAAGGMYDHVGGGFHRYSVDDKWLVPHFEKMLYDNAQLVVVYLEGYQATGRPEFADVAREILEYVSKEMTSPEGAFYSATDADSPTPEGHDEEGWFFTWSLEEVRAILDADQARLVERYYGMTESGNFEGRNILNVTSPLAEVAAELELEPDKAPGMLDDARRRMHEVRLGRPAPLRDDKVLTSWNGLMISAFAVGGAVLNEKSFTDRAGRAADFLLTRMRVDGRLRRTYKDGEARLNAYLDDYAFLIAGLLDLYETTWNPRWLREAIALQDVLDEHYGDGENGGYFMTSDDHETLLAREKPSNDGAEPSGNSVALMNLLRLHELTIDDRYRAAADRLLASFSNPLTRVPTGLSEMLLALDFRLGRPKEIVIVTPASHDQAEPFLAALRETYLPDRVVVVAAKGKDLAEQQKLVPLLEGKRPIKRKPTAYVCEQGVCKLPTSDVDEFVRQLTEPATPSAAAP